MHGTLIANAPERITFCPRWLVECAAGLPGLPGELGKHRPSSWFSGINRVPEAARVPVTAWRGEACFWGRVGREGSTVSVKINSTRDISLLCLERALHSRGCICAGSYGSYTFNG